MLYLIRSWTRGGRSTLKVGYTSDLKTRLSNYYHSNPGFELLGTREGDLTDEKKLQFYLEALGYKEKFLNEWFKDTPEVQSLFHQGRHKIHKTLWRHRDFLWGEGDRFIGVGREIYEELVLWFPGSPKSKADREYQKLINMELWRRLKGSQDDLFMM